LLLKASFQGPLLKKVHIYPVVIEKEQPRLADGEAADAVLRRTAELSRELGTSMTLANGVGVIELDRGDAGSGEIGDS
jgi:poly-gamma-glutamate synthesis protein (capsule biosynthesis protein)